MSLQWQCLCNGISNGTVPISNILLLSGRHILLSTQSSLVMNFSFSWVPTSADLDFIDSLYDK